MAFRFVLEPALIEKGVTPEELSEMTKIPLKTIMSMCDGSALSFNLKELGHICEALSCAPEDIIKDIKGDWHIINPKTGETTPTNTINY